MIRIDLGGVNAYLAKGEDGFVLFDTGGHMVMDKPFTNRRELLLKELESAGCTNLRLIVLTHGDNDHAHNAAFLRDRYHTKIAMHAGDRELVEKPTLRQWMRSFQYRPPLYRLAFRLMDKIITNVTQKTLDDFAPFSPDILLADGVNLSTHGLDATVIHVPGHTNGSIAVLTKDGDLIAGDTFTNMKKPGPAPNALDFGRLSISVDKLRGQPIKTVYPGHGEPFDFRAVN